MAPSELSKNSGASTLSDWSSLSNLLLEGDTYQRGCLGSPIVPLWTNNSGEGQASGPKLCVCRGRNPMLYPVEEEGVVVCDFHYAKQRGGFLLRKSICWLCYPTMGARPRFCEAGDVNKAEKQPLTDRVDSALKEIIATMKQLDRSAKAIEAINSFCHLRSHEPQESLTNIMLQFYKKIPFIGPDKNKQCDQAICLMYMRRISREMYGSYVNSYECSVMGMHGLESCKNHVTSFSLFLSRK
ncbi:hypothetical protein Tco_0548550, partial [Tanacetum coccineum]